MVKRNKIPATISLILCMLFSLTACAIAQPSDIQGHWAAPQINDWVDKGMAHGYPDGTFRPDSSISRAEFMTLTNQALGLTAQGAIQFRDVLPGDWFAAEVAKASAAGYISGYEDATMKPSQAISRQEAAAILAKIAGLDTSGREQINTFKDAGVIPGWSQGAINAVAAKEFMRGYPDKTFLPEKKISRAEAIVTLNNLIKPAEVSAKPAQPAEPVSKPADTTAVQNNVYDEAGVYGPASGSQTLTGDIIIKTSGITLQNYQINGTLTLTSEIGNGNVMLNGITVKGKTYIQGGGSEDITLKNCKIPDLVINKEGARVLAGENTVIRTTTLEKGAYIIEDIKVYKSSLENRAQNIYKYGTGFEEIIISDKVPADEKVILNGEFNIVTVNAKTNIELVNGKVFEFYYSSQSKGTVTDLDKDTKVRYLVLDGQVRVNGLGTVYFLYASALGAHVSLESPPVYYEGYVDETNAKWYYQYRTVDLRDSEFYQPLNLLVSVPYDGRTGVSVKPTIKLTFDEWVVKEYWDTNKNCISLIDSSGKVVPIEVYRYEDKDTEKRNIYVKPLSDLKDNEKYMIKIEGTFTSDWKDKPGNDIIINFTTAAA